jgi:MFS family permease
MPLRYHAGMNTATLSTPAVALRQDAAVIALVGLAHASSHFAHLLLPLLFPVFMREFGLSYSELGLLMSVFFVVSGLGQAGAGFVVDRFGAWRVLLISEALFIAACVLASLAQGYAGLLAVAVLAGLGNAPFHPVDFTILNQRVSAPRLGHAFSAHGLTGNLGWAAAPVFLVGLGGVLGWRGAYLAAAALYAAVLALLLAQRQRLRTEVHARAAAAQPGGDLAFLKLPVVWWCFAFFLLSTMTLALVQNYAVSLLQALHQVSLHAATFTLTAYMLCAALGIFIGGFVAARPGAHSDRVVAWCMGTGAVLMLLCGSGWLGAGGTMAALALTGLVIGVGAPSRDMMVKQATPKGATGRVYGTVYSGFDVGFAVAPLLFGALMDRGLYSATFFVAALVLLLSVATAVAGVGRRVRS